jgi:hypothetical protein
MDRAIRIAVMIPPAAREPHEPSPPAVRSGDTSAATLTRLQTIRAMVDSGTYPVDLDVLASRMVEVDDAVHRSRRS